nr:uncharacterized protein LOC110139988 isoform X3 [Odocoileus virginianus texanus]
MPPHAVVICLDPSPPTGPRNIAGDRVCCLWLHEGDQPVDTPRPTGTLSTVGLLPSAPAHAGSLKQLRRSAPRHLHWPRLGPPLPVSFLRSSAMASSQFQPAGAPHILLECLPCSALACPRVPANPSFQALSRGSPKSFWMFPVNGIVPPGPFVSVSSHSAVFTEFTHVVTARASFPVITE